MSRALRQEDLPPALLQDLDGRPADRTTGPQTRAPRVDGTSWLDQLPRRVAEALERSSNTAAVRLAARNAAAVRNMIERLGVARAVEGEAGDLALGTYEWELWDDGWTVLTRDGSRCAQFEHTLVVTDRGAEVLTL